MDSNDFEEYSVKPDAGEVGDGNRISRFPFPLTDTRADYILAQGTACHFDLW